MTAADLRARLALVVITDPDARIGTLPAVRASLQGGAGCVQVRWKGGPTRDFLDLTREIRTLTLDRGAILIVNDRIDIAMAAAADGAHLGDDDLPLDVARRVAGPEFILGRSVDNASEAWEAERAGADYVGLGPVFATATKTGLPSPIGLDTITEVRRRVQLPIVGIGGIDGERAGRVIRAGADGIAIVGAIMGSTDPESATRGILEAIRQRRDSPQL